MLEYTNLPKNITEYPNSFERQGAFPLERYSVFYNYEEAEEYALTDPVAYVGQPIAVVGEEVIYYIIDIDKSLMRFGTRLEVEGLDRRIRDIEQFFALEEGESLKETLDELVELQKWIEEHLGDFGQFQEETAKNFEFEANARIQEDIRLSAAISAEKTRATEAEAVLTESVARNAGQIGNEQEVRAEADALLLKDIKSEETSRKAQVSELQGMLNEEILRATNKERELSQNLIDTTGQIYNTLNVRFTQEATERTEAIEALKTDTQRSLNAEAVAREESDALLLAKISEESTERKDETEVLRSALFSEVETARAQESELSKKITAEERTRASEDVSIMISLNNEKQERQQEDSRILGIIGDIGNSTVTSRLDDLNQRMLDADDKLREDLAAETERANAADAELYEALAKETERANKADEELYAALAKETARAIAEEQMLAESLNKETSKLDILIGPDGEKSARTIANEELAAQLLSGKADADFKTLQQLAAWLEDHPEDVAAINKAIKDETDRALAAEAVIEKALKQESGRAFEAEQNIRDSFNEYENTIGFVKTGEKSLVEVFNELLETEASTREENDQQLQNNIDAIYKETTEKTTDENGEEVEITIYSGALANEIDRALGAENALNEAINKLREDGEEMYEDAQKAIEKAKTDTVADYDEQSSKSVNFIKNKPLSRTFKTIEIPMNVELQYVSNDVISEEFYSWTSVHMKYIVGANSPGNTMNLDQFVKEEVVQNDVVIGHKFTYAFMGRVTTTLFNIWQDTDELSRGLYCAGHKETGLEGYITWIKFVTEVQKLDNRYVNLLEHIDYQALLKTLFEDEILISAEEIE